MKRKSERALNISRTYWDNVYMYVRYYIKREGSRNEMNLIHDKT